MVVVRMVVVGNINIYTKKKKKRETLVCGGGEDGG